MYSFIFIFLTFALTNAFHVSRVRRVVHPTLCMSNTPKKNTKLYKVKIGLGEGYQPITTTFRPIFRNSKFFTVEYDIPFGLNIEKPPKGFPAPIVNKDSKGGEKVGDVLRATTCWSQGFSAAGATSDIAMFAGNIKWRKSLFDTTGAPWQEVINALTSNTVERSKTVTLVFEREIEAEEIEAIVKIDEKEKDDEVSTDSTDVE